MTAGIGRRSSTPCRACQDSGNPCRRRTLQPFALVNMTFHDALLSSFSGKFLYGLWRPVTAIREAARDGNAATEADPGWLALIPTPPYPTYPGNYACLASAITRGLARTFGRD